MNDFLQIFIENFLSRMILSPFSSITLEAKHSFGQNIQTELCVAYIAILLAFIVNYYSGRAFCIIEKYFDTKTKNLIAKAKRIFSGRGRVILLLSFVPFGNILLLVAGILHVPFKQTLPFMLIASGLGLLKFIL